MPIKGESLGEPRLSYKRLIQIITLHRTEIQIRFTPFEQARWELTYNVKHNPRERVLCDLVMQTFYSLLNRVQVICSLWHLDQNHNENYFTSCQNDRDTKPKSFTLSRKEI